MAKYKEIMIRVAVQPQVAQLLQGAFGMKSDAAKADGKPEDRSERGSSPHIRQNIFGGE